MITNVLGSSTLPTLEHTLHFARERHALLTGNIANLDTPGYRVRDLSVTDFQAALKEAIEARQSQPRAVIDGLGSTEHLSPARKVDEAMKHILYHDQSDVGLEQQVIAANKNQALHNLVVALMTKEFQQMEIAIRERI